MKSLKCFVLYTLGTGGPSEGSSCELTKSSKSAAGVGARDIFVSVSRIDFIVPTLEFAFRSTIYIIWATKLAHADEPLNSPPSLDGAKYIGKMYKSGNLAHGWRRCSKGGVSEFLNDLYVLLIRRLAQNGRFYFFGSFGLSVKFRRFHQMLYFIYFRDQWPPAGFEATLRHAEFLDDLYTYLNWAISHEGCFYSGRSCRLLKPACTPLQMLYFVYFWDQWPPMQSIATRGSLRVRVFAALGGVYLANPSNCFG